MRSLFEMDLLRKLKVKRKQRKPARDQILQRFDKWLDEVLAKEEPLEGIDQELFSELEGGNGPVAAGSTGDKYDLYATWSAITALTQEVRLQGRGFRDLSDKLEPLSGLGDSVEKLTEAHRDAVAYARRMAENARGVFAERENKLKLEAQARARHGVISVLLDIRERMIIGLRSASESQLKLDAYGNLGWLKRLFLKKNAGIDHTLEIVSSLKKGYRLGLDRLDEVMQQFGVCEISCEGKSFDPKIMTAVDIEERVDVSDGTVLEVYRTGYIRDTEVLWPAQVKVARAPEKHLIVNRRQGNERS